jgi:hypothetical protein
MNLDHHGNISCPDEIYEELLQLQDRVGSESWPLVSARLLLILINQIGDSEVLFEAFAWAETLGVAGSDIRKQYRKLI